MPTNGAFRIEPLKVKTFAGEQISQPSFREYHFVVPCGSRATTMATNVILSFWYFKGGSLASYYTVNGITYWGKQKVQTFSGPTRLVSQKVNSFVRYQTSGLSLAKPSGSIFPVAGSQGLATQWKSQVENREGLPTRGSAESRRSISFEVASFRLSCL